MYDFMYRNPRLAILAVSLIMVAGISSYAALPRMEDPILRERVAIINTIYPGANAERVEALVTEPIEESFRELEQIKRVTSLSRSGISALMVELNDEITNVDQVWSRVRDKLADTQPELPVEALAPSFRQMHMKAFAMIVAITWEQDAEPNYDILRRHAEQLEDAFLAITGTQKIRTFGDPDEEFVVTVDPNKLAGLGLTVNEVAAALNSTDSKVSAGLVRGINADTLIEVEGELLTKRQIGQTPIRVGAAGQTLRLDDIAKIKKGIAHPASDLAYVNGHAAVAIGILVRDHYRVDSWTQKANRLMADYSGRLPEGAGLHVVFRQNDYVESRLLALLWNLILGAAGVMAVILLLMGWRSALIVGTALPLSAMMVLTGMNLMGIPIHQMSITGLIIALGLLIDNAIVMVDETTLALRRGLRAVDAVSGTVRHLLIPLTGSTVTTALAFAPIALMDGPTGEFVGSIAISVMLAIFSSLLLAMTLIPALTAWGIDHRERISSRWWSTGVSSGVLRRGYSAVLKTIIARPWLGIASGIVLPIAGFTVAAQLPEQFFPPADRDQFQIEVELPAQSSLQKTRELTRQIRQHVLAEDQVVSVDWFLGQSAPTFYYNVISRRENTASYAQGFVQLDGQTQTRELIDRLQGELDQKFPNARVLVRQLEQGPPFDAPVEIRIFGPDLNRLREIGNDVRSRLAKLPNVVHTRSDLAESIPKLSINVDEESARAAGLDRVGIAGQLQSSLEGKIGGAVLEATEELPIRVRFPDQDRAEVQGVASMNLQVAAPTSQLTNVPLTALATVGMTPETSVIMHRHGQRMNEVQAYIKAGVLPATVLSELEKTLEERPLNLPPGYRLAYGGEAAERDSAVGKLISRISVLATLMVATLVLSFGSFRLAGVIGTVAMLSLGLGVGALWVFGYPFGFMAIIGSMGLMGVAINDAIVVLAGLKADESASRGDPKAMHDVVMQLTRHVIATTLTTIAGFAPLVISGGGFWPPLAIAIAGGVTGATILALLFVPSLYLILMCRPPLRSTQGNAVLAARANETSSPPASESPESQGIAQAEPGIMG